MDLGKVLKSIIIFLQGVALIFILINFNLTE